VRFISAAVDEVVGLFVGDWTQTIVSIAILGFGWLALSRLHVMGLAFLLCVALAVQLVLATAAEARRTRRT
jgi:uncharacterized membrane protein YczE